MALAGLGCLALGVSEPTGQRPLASPPPRGVAAVAPVSSLWKLALRLESDWRLEPTGKSYWIGYTRDMRQLAAHGEAALPALARMARTGSSDRARYGALLAIHCMGIQGRAVGRYMEAFTFAPARRALLELLDQQDLQLRILTLLIRDPWITDVPRLFEVLASGTPHGWAVVKALQRYGLAGAPVHQPIPPALARVRIPGVAGQGPVAALRATPGGVVAVEPGVEALVGAPGWSRARGSGDHELGSLVKGLTSCDYLELGLPVDYYLDQGTLRLCSATTAKIRWLRWRRQNPGLPPLVDPPGWVLFASGFGGVERVAALLDAYPQCVNVQRQKTTPLHQAAAGGLTEVVALLLARGADPSLVGEEGQLALHVAAKEGNHETVAVLLEQGSAIHQRDGWGRTALAIASAEGHAKTVDLLVRRGASVDVFVAAGYGPDERLVELLDQDPRLVDRIERSRSPLHEAARHGRLEAVRVLIARGADPRGGATAGGNTPLHEAARGGHSECVLALLEGGASVDPGGRWLQTPLQEAAREERFDAVRVLLEAGASVDHDRGGEAPTALEFASRNGNLALVLLLLEHGASARAIDPDHANRLYWAEGQRWDAIREQLRAAGATITELGPGR